MKWTRLWNLPLHRKQKRLSPCGTLIAPGLRPIIAALVARREQRVLPFASNRCWDLGSNFFGELPRNKNSLTPVVALVALGPDVLEHAGFDLEFLFGLALLGGRVGDRLRWGQPL